MTASLLLLAPFLILLLLAAAWDLASYTIPNWIQFGLLLSFILFAVTAGFPAAAFANHLLAAAAGLLLGFTLFAFGFMGGGDAKLFACVAVWFGFPDVLQYALGASIVGGALTLAVMAVRRWPLPDILARQRWIARLHNAQQGIPYGVALAAGALLVLPHTDVFRAAL